MTHERIDREELAEPENLEVRRDDTGVLRWWMATREGWELVGVKDGREIVMRADTYAEGTRLTLVEPIQCGEG